MRIFAAASFCVLTVPGCSQAAPEDQAAAPARPSMRPTPRAEAGSRILSMTDEVRRGEPSCAIRFVYEGHAPEPLWWGEPCKAVTAVMMDPTQLDALGRWARLDAFQQRDVVAMPGGRVLYVGGAFTASVYPIGRTGTSYAVSVAD